MRGGDLRQPDGGDVAGIAAKGAVHLFIHPLRLDRHVVEVGFAQQRLLALQTGGAPGVAIRQLAALEAALCRIHQHLQRDARVGDDAQIRADHPANLRRLDIDMHHLAPGGVLVHRAGVAVGPAVADAEHQIRIQQVGVAVAVRGLQARHARHQRVIVRNGAPAHQGRDYRHVADLRQLLQQIRRVGVVNAAAGDDQRFFRRAQQIQRFVDLRLGGRRLIGGQ